MYYHLSRARQARRIRDVVLVRLEQIAPFPHDLVGKVRQDKRSALSRTGFQGTPLPNHIRLGMTSQIVAGLLSSIFNDA